MKSLVGDGKIKCCCCLYSEWQNGSIATIVTRMYPESLCVTVAQKCPSQITSLIYSQKRRNIHRGNSITLRHRHGSAFSAAC